MCPSLLLLLLMMPNDTPHQTCLLQWNARSILPRITNFRSLINLNHVQVFALSETWLTEDKDFYVPHFNIIRSDRDRPYGGVLLGFKHGIEFNRIQIDQSSPIEIVAATANLKPHKVTIASIYIPPNVNLRYDDLQNIINLLPPPLMLLGDFNSKGCAWGEPTDDSRAKTLYEITDEFDLVFLNTGEITRIACPEQQCSRLDLSLCSSRLGLDCSWKVIDDPSGSDHLPIVISLQACGTASGSMTNYDLTKHIDWDRYKREMSAIVSGLDPSEDPLETHKVLIQSIKQTAHESQTKPIPTNCRTRNNPTVWWDWECSKMLIKRSNAFKKFRSSGSTEDFLNYKKVEAESKRLFKIKKRGYWRQLIETFDKDTALRSLWSIAKKMRNSYTPRENVNSYSEEWIERFGNKICPAFVPNEKPEIAPVSETEDCHDLTKDFSIEELESALRLAENNAPGIDGVKFALLKNLPLNAKHLLLKLYNDFYKLNICPETWYEVKVLPILKPGKNASDHNSYRPISLLVCDRKAFEKMMLARIEHWSERENVISPSQYGFRRTRGTRDCLAKFSTAIQVAFAKKENLTAVFLDISGAFDSIRIDILYRKLISAGLPRQISDFLFTLFKMKNMHFTFNGHIKESRVGYLGVPQGSCLSPLLYNIYVNDIDACIADDCELIQFADDAVLWISEKDDKIAKCHIQSSIQNLELWSNCNGLTFSSSKTEVMVFSRKHKLPEIKISMDKRELKSVESHKYLGIYFDRKCLWGGQIREIARKCQKRINFLKAICGTWWGAHPSDMITLYKTTVLSVIEYGSITFCNAAKTHLLKLERIQYRAIRICLGSMMSTHTSSLEVMAGIKPLKLRFEELNLRYMAKSITVDRQLISDLNVLKNLKPEHHLVSYYNTLTEMNVHSSIFASPTNFEIDDYIFVPQIDLSLHTELGNVPDDFRGQMANQLFRIKTEDVSLDNLFFTDGSKSHDTVGFGLYHKTIRLSYKLQPPASIFCAEALAIHEACKIINNLPFGLYMICSDSMSALKALSSGVVDKHASSFILQIKQTLRMQYSRGYVIKFLWVPAHCGIHGNESADDLAKTGALTGDFFERSILNEEYLPIIKSYVQDKWQQKWTDDNLGRFCHSILPKTNAKPWFSQYDFNRNLIKNMSRLMANHFCLSSHLFRIGIKQTNVCECGNGYEDFDHVLWYCQKYDDHRRAMTDELHKQGLTTLSSIRDILSIPNKKILIVINDFINKAKIIL